MAWPGGVPLSFAPALPYGAAAPGKDTHEECQDCDEEAKRSRVDGPGTIKGEPDQKADATDEKDD